MKTTTVILCIGSISRSWYYQWHIDSIVIVMDILYNVQANISNNFSSTTKRNYNKSAKQQHIYRIIKVTSKPSRALIHWTVRRLTTRFCEITKPLQWRHIEGDVSNHQSRDCLLNRLFRRWSKKTSKLRVTGLYVGNSPVTGEFPAQRASNAESVSIWWRHHDVWNFSIALQFDRRFGSTAVKAPVKCQSDTIILILTPYLAASGLLDTMVTPS